MKPAACFFLLVGWATGGTAWADDCTDRLNATLQQLRNSGQPPSDAIVKIEAMQLNCAGANRIRR
jgi:hypothetical protein